MVVVAYKFLLSAQVPIGPLAFGSYLGMGRGLGLGLDNIVSSVSVTIYS